MADSFNKKEREKKKRKRKQDKIEKRKQNKIDAVKPLEFMYVMEDGTLSPTPPDPTKKRKITLEEIEISTSKKTDDDSSKFQKEGIVKFYNDEKGFGFISEANSNDDYFVHVDNIEGEIREKDKVSFEVGAGPKGPVALKVKILPAKKKEVAKKIEEVEAKTEVEEKKEDGPAES
jgi:cold shock CspA family protein